MQIRDTTNYIESIVQQNQLNSPLLSCWERELFTKQKLEHKCVIPCHRLHPGQNLVYSRIALALLKILSSTMDHKSWLWKKRSTEKAIISDDKTSLSSSRAEEEVNMSQFLHFLLSYDHSLSFP